MATPVSKLATVSPGEVVKLLQGKGPRAWRDLVETHGRTFRIGSTVATADPEIVDALLTGKDHRDGRPGGYLFIGKWMPGQRGLVFIDGAWWKAQTRALVPALARPHVRAISRSVTETIEATVDGWFARGRLDDATEACRQLNDALFLRGAFGRRVADAASTLGGLFRRWLETQHDERFRFDAPALRARNLLSLPGVLQRAGRTFAAVTDERRRLDDAGNRDPESWLARLEAEGVTGRDADAALTHVFWAADALAYVLACSLVSLATNPASGAAVRDEVRRVAGDGPLDWDVLERLPLTRAFVREVLRCNPASMGVLRTAGAPLETADVRIEKGRDVLLLMYALHHEPASFERPDTFDPTRWLDSWTPPPGSYIPFVAGPRKCSGQAFAELALGTLVASVARRGELAIHGKVPPLDTFMVPRFTAPVPMSLAIG